MPSLAYQIKPLVWVETGNNFASWRAETFGRMGLYHILGSTAPYSWKCTTGDESPAIHPTIEAAKEAAESHYRNRLLEALEPVESDYVDGLSGARHHNGVRALTTNDTPAAHWRENGRPDPHDDRYACKRSDLVGGSQTDDEIANALFLATGDIHIQTAAKDRVRWLSRQTVALDAENAGLRGTIDKITTIIAMAPKPTDKPDRIKVTSDAEIVDGHIVGLTAELINRTLRTIQTLAEGALQRNTSEVE